MDGKLRRLLEQALIAANGARNMKQTFVLGRGLQVELYVDEAGEVHLLLGRQGVYPADHERDTVLRCWPQPLPDPAPAFEQKKARGRHALVASWRPPRPEMAGLG